jgi:restriction system protein
MAKRQSQFVQWMGPILDAIRELGGSGKPREVCDLVAERSTVTDKRLEESLKSGQTRYYNQVHWARQYLVWEGLLDGSTHGVWTLTPTGYKTKLDAAAARTFSSSGLRFMLQRNEKTELKGATALWQMMPMLSAIRTIKYLLLELLKKVTPEGFERVCARLLRESGFEKVTVTGRPKDGGIDGIGILQVNPFVSFKVLFQCKRYKGAVSRA